MRQPPASWFIKKAADYARDRVVFGRPIADYQLTQAKLGRMAVLIHAGRTFSYHVARLMSAGDGTLEALRRAHEADARVKAVSFSRNFGKEIAIAAGLDHTDAAAVVIIDADLQHPPETIADFIAKWREEKIRQLQQR